ncbi:MAG: PEP-CTERM sorting domain-containing protein [Opitutales bacterium]
MRLSVFLIATSALVSLSANAAITGMSGQMAFDETPGSYEDTDVIMAFDEQQHVKLKKHLKVDWELSPAFDGNLNNKIAEGLHVSSHYFYLKTEGCFSSENAWGHADFDGKILGVIFSKHKMNKAVEHVGLQDIDYPGGLFSGSSSLTQDDIQITDNGYGATMKMNVHRIFCVGGYDAMRVITHATKGTVIPEPSTWAFLAGFGGFLGLSLRRRHRKNA